jgi:protein arginine kinase activator
MKCDVCESEATVFLTQIINGQMTTVNLCDACSKAKGVTDEAGFGLAEAFLSTQAPEAPAAETVCGACGFTASQLKKIGRMGCPECYTTFRSRQNPSRAGDSRGTRGSTTTTQAQACEESPAPERGPATRAAG